MKRRSIAVLFSVALAASVAQSLPAQAAPTVPEEPNITDPVGDSNYLNDGNFVPIGKNTTTPADAGSVSDIMAVWFTDDADSISAHFQTEAPGPAIAALFYRVRVDPGVGANCMWFQGTASGAGNPNAEGTASLRTTGDCGAETVGEGAEFIQEEGPDGTGIHTIKIPRALSSAFVDGRTLTAISAEVTNFIGAVTAPTLDNTEVGTDYVIGSGGDAPKVEEPEDEPKKDEPKKIDCKKKKNKKKKACKKNGDEPVEEPKAGCAAYEPGEMGAEAESFVVTDEHTEDAPLEITIDHDTAIFPASVSDRYSNIQVDSDAAEAGLYISYQFPDYEDHDLYIHYPDGAEAAHVAGFNPAPFVPATPVTGSTDGTGTGGHSEMGAEVLDGLRTADCQGWTANWHNFIGEGGEYTVTLWLGEIQNDPAAPAE